jgi:ankyrin repeat protein
MDHQDIEQAILNGQEDAALRALLGVEVCRSDLIRARDRSLLGLAAERGFVRLVSAILAAGADPNERSGIESPLHRAIAAGKEDVARRLIEYGATLECASGGRPVFTWLASMARSMSQSALSYLLLKADECGSDPNAQDALGTALHHLLHDESSWLVEPLCRFGADPNQLNPSGTSPLYLYALLRRPCLMQAILRYGANVDAIGPTGMTSLYLSCLSDVDYKVVSMLLQAGANANTMTDGWPLLHSVVSDGDLELARMLVNCGADVNRAEAKDMLTPLMVAVRRGQLECVSFLLHSGADRWARDAIGRTINDFIHEVKSESTREALMSMLGC